VHSNSIYNDNKEIAAYAQSFEASPLLPLAQALQVKELKETQPMAEPKEAKS